MRLYGKLLQTISEVRLSLYPSLFPRDPLDKSQLHAKQPSEVGGETHSTPQPTHLSFSLLQSTLSEVWTFPGRYTSMGYPVS